VATLIPNGTGGVYTYYIHTEHLNAPRKISRPSDNVVVWTFDGDAYGNGSPNQDPDGNGVPMVYNVRVMGLYADQDSGLVQNWWRTRSVNSPPVPGTNCLCHKCDRIRPSG